MPAIRGSKSKKKTRRHTRDIDEITADLKSTRHLARYQLTKFPEDLPALGAYYCVECAKWFESEFNMLAHRKGGPHRRQIKLLKDGAHTQREAEEAIGLGVDNGKTGNVTHEQVELDDKNRGENVDTEMAVKKVSIAATGLEKD